MTDLHTELMQAQEQVSALKARIKREKAEEIRTRLRCEEKEPGARLYAAIGLAIRKVRKDKRITQAVLGEVVGVSRVSIVNIEAGRQRPPLDLLYDIADALGVEATELLPRNEDV